MGAPQPAECCKYEFGLDEWTVSGTMAEARTLGGYDSSEDWGLILAGGFVPVGSSISSTVETTQNGEVFESLPDLPDGNWDSCLVIVDQDRFFTCGGYITPSDTLIFQKSTNSWNR